MRVKKNPVSAVRYYKLRVVLFIRGGVNETVTAEAALKGSIVDSAVKIYLILDVQLRS